jgi:glycosyltransferase involved in cell wall biosynthesis
MNVLLIHQAFTSGQDAGGTRHYELGQRLAAQGDKLQVVASQVGYLSGRRVRTGRGGLFYRENIGGIEVLRAYAPAVHNRGFGWRIWTFLVFMTTSAWAGLRAGPADLVMGTSPPIFQGLSAWLVARLRRVPFLLEIRDLWPEFAIDMGMLKIPVLQSLARRLETFLYRHADHLLVNSPAYRDYLLKKGVPAAKISFVANGVDIDMFRPDTDGAAIRSRFGLEGKTLVVYAGAHGMANDLGTILQAAERLRSDSSLHFLFVGDGKERANLESEARRLNLSNVTFAGPLPKEAMPDVLAAADICVATLMNIPMFATTYPNKVFDYMAAGRPTVLGIDGVIRRVLEEADGGLCITPGDPVGLADAIARLADDAGLRDRMGRSARRHVATHFDRRTQAEEFRDVLRHVGAA